MSIPDIERDGLERLNRREAKERLGVMRKVKLGVDDRDCVSLQFTLYTDESYASQQWIRGMENIENIILDAGVSDIRQLEGQTCWVNTEQSGLMVFIEIAKL